MRVKVGVVFALCVALLPAIGLGAADRHNRRQGARYRQPGDAGGDGGGAIERTTGAARDDDRRRRASSACLPFRRATTP